jgi:hypothetical protein
MGRKGRKTLPPQRHGRKIAMANISVTATRRLNISQARGHLWIAKLRRLPDGMFERAVKQLISGVGPTAVAKALVELQPQCAEFKGLKLPTYKKYLCALNQRLKTEMYGVKRKDFTEVARGAVRAEFERQKTAALSGDAETIQPAKKIWNVVTKAVRELDAETALRYAFVTQVARVEMMREMEKNDPSLILSDNGHNQIAVLRAIGAELVKLELKRTRSRGTNGRFVAKSQQPRMDAQPDTQPTPL